MRLQHNLAYLNSDHPEDMKSGEFSAMGTTISFIVPVAQFEEANVCVTDLFTQWEKKLSRFLPDSELSVLNRQNGWVSVSPFLYTILEASVQAAQSTDGVFDPTMAQQIRAVGYDVSFDLIDHSDKIEHVETTPGGAWRDVRFDARQSKIFKPIAAAFDVGGIAKGMAADAALQALRDIGVLSAAVNAGGDIAVMGRSDISEGWNIAVPAGDKNQIVHLLSGAIATSGKGRRYWYRNGELQHHLLNPLTGQSVQNTVAAVSAAAGTCREAEVAAKTAFILGLVDGSLFLLNHGLSGVFLNDDGTRLSVGSWPKGE